MRTKILTLGLVCLFSLSLIYAQSFDLGPIKIDVIKTGPPHDRSRLTSVKIKITNTSKKHIETCELSCILYKGDKEVDVQTEYVISSALGGTGLKPNRFIFFEYIFSIESSGWNKIGFQIENIKYKK